MLDTTTLEFIQVKVMEQCHYCDLLYFLSIGKESVITNCQHAIHVSDMYGVHWYYVYYIWINAKFNRYRI